MRKIYSPHPDPLPGGERGVGSPLKGMIREGQVKDSWEEKMSDKSPKQKDGLLEFLKKLWLPVAGFLDAITLAYNFYQLWLGDQATVTWFLVEGWME